MSVESNKLANAEPTPLRVLVVDDSTVQRRMLVALLDGDPDLNVIGWAASGQEAVRAVARLRPDVVTMDLSMPGMDGVKAARLIMQETPTPIVMVTASQSRADQNIVAQAFRAGILAVAEKPVAGAQSAQMGSELLRTVKSMARVRVIRRWGEDRLRPPESRPANPVAISLSKPRSHVADVIAIGASTGGPQAVSDILSRLPQEFPIPILLVQHIAPGFVGGLVEWLRSTCPVPVQLAEAGQRIVGPGVFVAPTGQHLRARGRALAISSGPLVSGHCPSVTVLFQSVAQEYRSAAIGVLLTGMGQDGAAGLSELKRVGALTIAQDQASSVVFGMPAAAIDLGIVDYRGSPADISRLLASAGNRSVVPERRDV